MDHFPIQPQPEPVSNSTPPPSFETPNAQPPRPALPLGGIPQSLKQLRPRDKLLIGIAIIVFILITVFTLPGHFNQNPPSSWVGTYTNTGAQVDYFMTWDQTGDNLTGHIDVAARLIGSTTVQTKSETITGTYSSDTHTVYLTQQDGISYKGTIDNNSLTITTQTLNGNETLLIFHTGSQDDFNQLKNQLNS